MTDERKSTYVEVAILVGSETDRKLGNEVKPVRVLNTMAGTVKIVKMTREEAERRGLMARRTWEQVEQLAEQHNLKILDHKKKERRRIIQDMNEHPDYCFCYRIFGYSNVPRSDSDPILSTFKYHYKYDFNRKRPKLESNMRRCHICGGKYSDAPLMA